MHKFILHAVKGGLVLGIALVTPGCALTTPVQNRVEGYTTSVKDSSPRGWHEETHEPQPAYIPLMLITIPVDIVTFPIQAPFVVCIWRFYDVQFCDTGGHNSSAAVAYVER